MLALPMTMAPASSNFCSDGALPAGRACRSAGVPAEVGMSAVLMLSFDDGQARKHAGLLAGIDPGGRYQRTVPVQNNECIEVFELLGAIKRSTYDADGRHFLVADGNNDLRGGN